MIEFEASSHTYRVDGVVRPSVTQILRPLESSFAFVDAGVLEAARAFGQHVHKAIELFNLGELDEDALDPALAPYLAQWKKFIFETGFEWSIGEQLVYNALSRYAGRLDVMGLIRGRVWMIDLKSGAVPKTAQLQTAGYSLATTMKPRRRAALQLMPDRYRFIVHEDLSDFAYFQSLVNLHHWKEQHGH